MLLLFALGCTDPAPYRPSDLKPVSRQELIRRALRFAYPNGQQMTYRNEAGEIIPYDSLLTIPNPTLYALDYYENDAGEIVEAVIRESTEADRDFQKRYQQVANTGPELRKVEVNCSDKAAFLQGVFERDQSSRHAGLLDRKTDHENLELITSFLDKCGVPDHDEIDDVQRAAIWTVLQHGPRDVRLAYLPQLEAAAGRGDIGPGAIAMMRDRLLVEEGKPQLYGTQVHTDPGSGQNSLHPLSDPATVDRRRAEVGLGPLREYLQRFAIDFAVPQR